MTRRGFLLCLATPIAGADKAPQPEVTVKRLSLQEWFVYYMDAAGWHGSMSSTATEALNVARNFLLRDIT